MGGPGDDTLTGGTGADHLDGGAGNDTFETRDAAVDTIVCGTETDSGHADSADSVVPDCESVLKPAAPVVTPPSTGPVTVPLPDPPATEPPTPDPSTPIPTQPITPAANAVPPTVPPQTVGVSASGVARVRVVCPADSGGCSGTVTIEIPGATSSGGHAKAAAALKAIVVGKARFRAKAGTSPTIPVRLTKRGRQRILRGRRGRARIVVT